VHCECKILFYPEKFAEQLRENLEYHNFMLTQYYGASPVDYKATLDEAMSYAARIKPMVVDVSSALYAAGQAGQSLLFEGAQGTLLDIDHGTYPYVTSSNCVAGNAAAGSGVGPESLQYILGITKAYCTRVGAGPSQANSMTTTIPLSRIQSAFVWQKSVKNLAQ
jgi:adenylosuccinate synthase